MADVITRLRIDSGEYDSKIKRATQGLLQMEQECRRVGGTLAILEKDQLQYVQSLGKMQTVSQTARGKLNELTQAYTDLSLQYKRLTDEEKKGDFGKALSSSLDQLKGRINETKGQLSDVSRELGNTGTSSSSLGNIVESLTGKLGLNITQLTGWGAAIGAGTTVLKVSKDAFMASEAAVDEWGRIVDSSRSLYEGFLNSLNNGDISGFLSRIDQIVQAARDAYNELDRLGTMKTIQAPAMSAQMTENERMRQMIQTRRYIAPVDGRRATMANGTILSDAQVRSLEQKLQNGMQKVVSLVGNEVRQTNRAIDAVYRRQGAELGMSVKEFRKGTSSMAEFERRVAGAEKYRQWQQDNSYVDQSTGRLVAPRGGNPYAQYKGWDVFRVDGQRYNDLVKLIQQRDQQASQAYSIQTQAFRTINRAEGITARIGSGGRGGGGRTTKTTPKAEEVLPVGSVAALNKEIQELRKEQERVTDPTAWQEYQTQIDTLTQKMKIFKGEITDPSKIQKTAGVSVLNSIIGTDRLEEVERQIKAMLPEKGIKIPAKLEINTDSLKGISNSGKQMGESWKAAASAIQSVGGALTQIEDPAARVAGTVAQAIATIALGYAQATAEASKLGPWGWIAFAGTGLATMLTTIASIKSATKGYAEGGQFRGKYMSGDNNIIGINDGELILNRAQQGNLASQFHEQGGHGYRPSYISGEQIYLALNRYTRRTGRGEIVTWK